MLRREGFEFLGNLGSLKKLAGTCPTCNVDCKLIAQQTGDGLLSKFTKCKAKKNSIKNDYIFSNRKLSL